MTEKPDPSDLEPIDESRYVHQRDENGDLIPIEDVIKVAGEWKPIKHIPATKGLLMRIQNKFAGRDDIDVGELDAVMDDWFVEPSFDNWDDVKPELYIPLLNYMTEKLGGEVDDEITEEMRDEIERRQAGGN